ncbi:MAG: glutaredoxin family protein [Deltaproteobacteria bacterium]|nr:glutaredoxin family protein [Deltaproteobacteria bacterium]
MAGHRVSSQLWVATLLVATALSGCEEISGFVENAVGATEPQPPPQAEHGGEETEAKLPERPATSTATSETQVITFRSILDNRELSREERIRAFENLDPAALQKPVARSNVTGGPPTASIRRQPRQDEPSQSELSAARRRVPVVMYSTSWCGVCKRARKYFHEAGISFVEYDVDENASARAEYLRLNPRRSVPTIKVGDEVIVGFSAQAVNAALDAATQGRLH